MTYNPPNTELAVGEVGYVSWQYSLITNHLPLDGSTINDFGTDYPELLAFFTDNNLVTSVQADYDANHALLLYDSVNDEATMPDFLDKTVWGGNTVEEKEAGLPNIQGTQVCDYGNSSPIGAWSGARTGAFNSNVSANKYTQTVSNDTSLNRVSSINFDASRSSSIYGNSTTVQPPAITLIPQIRYKKDTIINDGTPVGTVISFFGLTAPTGYLSCDGTVYNIADYSALADHINTQFGSYNYFGGDGATTFAVPDLRGEFLRGTGTNSHTNQGNGSNVGVHQDGTEFNEIQMSSSLRRVQMWNAGDWGKNIIKHDSARTTSNNVYIDGSSGSTSTPGEGIHVFTSRPTNTSVLYCIRYT
jgi:microcystin-dependent protein